MALFVAVVTGDLAKIFLFSIGRGLIITSSSWSTTLLVLLFVIFPLMRLLLLVFVCLFREFFGLGALFGLVGLTLRTLWGRAGFLSSFRLFVPRIEAYFQRPFSPGTTLVEMGTFLNLDSGLGFIGCID